MHCFTYILYHILYKEPINGKVCLSSMCPSSKLMEAKEGVRGSQIYGQLVRTTGKTTRAMILSMTPHCLARLARLSKNRDVVYLTFITYHKTYY